MADLPYPRKFTVTVNRPNFKPAVHAVSGPCLADVLHWVSELYSMPGLLTDEVMVEIKEFRN